MRRIYLAARYGRRQELLAYAGLLERDGHTITSLWLDGRHEGRADADYAREDLDDLDDANTLLSFTEQPSPIQGRARGGRHVEFGYALARHLDLLLVGPREHCFHALWNVHQFDTFEAARTWLREPAP